MILLQTRSTPRRDPEAQSETNESMASTTVADSQTIRKVPSPSIHSAAKARVYKWSRRIMITTESLWLKKIRRNKLKTFIYIFLPSVFIFLLAFSFAPPSMSSNSNNLLFFMGGILQPPMMFTAGVAPKRIHSRRDSFNVRYTPLLAALGYGATSIEIYLWTKGDTLYVGAQDPDNPDSYDQTLQDVYLSKLQMLLEYANNDGPDGTTRGVFQSAPSLPLQLVMNIRSPPPQAPTIQALSVALQPFLHQGMLTTLDTRDPGASLNQSALTIIMTGCIEPSDTFDPQSPVQYMFVDAPLQQLDGNEGGGPLSPLSNTLMASATFSSLVGSRWVIPRLAKKKIVQYVELAHSKGIAVRVTEPIDFPVWLRNTYWQILLDCGVDWLDVDDLEGASRF